MRKEILYQVTFGEKTGGVLVAEDGTIIKTALFLRKFIGQHVIQLDAWLDKFQCVKVEVVP